MREIRFRLWNRAAMEPVGSVTLHTDGSYHVNDEYPVNDSEMRGRFGGDRYFLMQFTGLRDKNGKDIYEGDIVKPSHNYHYRNTDVYFDQHYAAFFIRGDEDEAGYILNKVYCASEVEVIGNIYETPELIE